MKLPLFQVDAFTDQPLKGNPAAIVVLDQWLDDSLLQAIAVENNLSETAYMRATADDRYELRWFTPVAEVDLCGHATLAAAWVHFNRLEGAGDSVIFDTCSGPLPVTRSASRLVLDLPSRPGKPSNSTAQLLSALRISEQDIECVIQARETMVVLRQMDTLTGLEPDMTAISQLDTFAVMVTARGSDCDFASRYFAPAQGIPEDPVTGSAHCTLVPWWTEQLGKGDLHARQLSRRGGELWCSLKNDRVHIAGSAVCVLEGTLILETSA